jgi:hypothetical protein
MPQVRADWKGAVCPQRRVARRAVISSATSVRYLFRHATPSISSATLNVAATRRVAKVSRHGAANCGGLTDLYQPSD